ncbi:MAG: aromatic amino acid transport family protein [Patescibacteria group bacterium]
MKEKTKSFHRAALTMFGTIVGAGVFTLPAFFKSTGIFAGSIVYWVLALAVLAMHLLYADIALRRGSLSRRKFPGHVAVILGPWPGMLALLVHPLSLIGICFAYLLLGGEFLASLSHVFGGPESVLFWQILFWIGGAITVFFGLRVISRVEAWLAWCLAALLVLAIALFIPRVDVALFASASWSHLFAPFGIILFALSAYPVVPDVAEICGRDRARTMRAVTIGSLGAAFLMWLFGILGFAAVGAALSADPGDVARAFPPSFFWLLPAVGFLAVATSFIMLMEDLRGTFRTEFHLSDSIAWILALGAPMALLFLTERNFLETTAFVGSMFGAIIGMLISCMAMKNGRRTPHTARRIVAMLCATLFFLAFMWGILFI